MLYLPFMLLMGGTNRVSYIPVGYLNIESYVCRPLGTQAVYKEIDKKNYMKQQN